MASRGGASGPTPGGLQASEAHPARAGMEESPRWLPRPDLQRLIELLRERHPRVLGPVLRDGATSLREIFRVEDLPLGQRDEQAPGYYRISPAGGERVFDVVNGPTSLKALVFPPREELLQVQIAGGSFEARPSVPDVVPTAVIGVRACDLSALAVQDRIFVGDRFPDPYYAARREALFLVGVNCTRFAATCFCTSMGTGPRVSAGHDLVLTEQQDGFVASAGSRSGHEVLEALELVEAPPAALEEEQRAVAACAADMPRRMEARDLHERLYEQLEHPRWDDVAERCLSCGNCTQVCPTCFCHDERDEPELSGEASLRVREWDSCFDRAYSQVHGINFRPRIRDRYRQWLVHKLAGWVHQFGTSGCVGCGRCIAWCPVGIDLTEEVDALLAEAPAAARGDREPPG